ncbi:MAG: class I SAM-dependent methyltransferase [Sedimenticola sp.]
MNRLFKRLSKRIASEGGWLAVIGNSCRTIQKHGFKEFVLRAIRLFTNVNIHKNRNAYMLSDYIRRYADETGVVSSVHHDDMIFRFLVENPHFKTVEDAVEYYFKDGARSSRQLKKIIFSDLGINDIPAIQILEFASGYGCVTRHLVNDFLEENIVSCDIHREACSFISSEMRVKAILSSTSPADFQIATNQFDIVFALSFFSHMPDSTWGAWQKALFKTIKPGGYFIFTTHGMTSASDHFGGPIIPESGIWFVPDSEQKDLDVKDYGNTIVTQEYVNTIVNDVLHASILIYVEACWWGHQDLYVVRKV